MWKTCCNRDLSRWILTKYLTSCQYDQPEREGSWHYKGRSRKDMWSVVPSWGEFGDICKNQQKFSLFDH
jgi:hypothetical protein